MPDIHPAFIAALDREVASHPPGFITVTEPHGAALSTHRIGVCRVIDRHIRRREVAVAQLDDGAVEVEILGEADDINRVGPQVQSALRRAGYLLRRGWAAHVALVYPDGWRAPESQGG